MINIDIKGQISESGAKEIAAVSAKNISEGKRFLIQCAGVALVCSVVFAGAAGLVYLWKG